MTVPGPPPAPVTSFVGRTGELELIDDLLSAPGLVTLLGSPGAGKTRLALEAIRRIGAGAASEGPAVSWVELAPVPAGGPVEEAIAAALGIHDQAGRPIVDAIAAALGLGRQLLVLDNCEHVAAGCAEVVATLVRECLDLTILATSRQALNVEGEQPFDVPPMSTAESTELFYERAGRHQLGFAVGDDSAAAVTEICRRLDGVPLAVELAAGRVGLLPPAEIAARLADDPLAMLSKGNRKGDDRHQSLGAALEWSYAQLDPAEATLLNRLSAFTGGFTTASATTVCAGGPVSTPDVGDLLTALAAKSLIVSCRLGGESGFDLLDTVRRFAANHLVDSGESAQVAARHTAWCVAFAEDVEAALTGGDQLDALARVDGDIDNLRAAFFGNLDRQPQHSLRIAAALTLWWRVRGRFAEGRRWLDAALGRTPGAPDSVRAKALWGAGFLAHMLDDDDGAAAALLNSLGLARDVGDRRLEARALLVLGNVAMENWQIAKRDEEPRVLMLLGRVSAEHFEPATRMLEASAALAAQIGDHWCRSLALALCGLNKARSASADDPGCLLDEAIALARAEHDVQALGVALHVRGHIALQEGDHATAECHLSEALATTRSLGDSYGLAVTLGLLGELALLVGEHQTAGDSLERSLAADHDIDRLPATRRMPALCTLGWLSIAEGDVDSARGHFQEAQLIAGARGLILAEAVCGLGFVALAEGDTDDACTLFDNALADAATAGDRMNGAYALRGLASVAARQGDVDRSAALWRRAMGLWHELGRDRELTSALQEFALDTASSSGTRRAVRVLAASQAIGEARGYPRPPAVQARVDDCVSELRRRLGPKEVDEAWESGWAMSLDEAVRSAIQGHGPVARPAQGWPSLNGAEQEVVRLIAQGCSNNQIARRLFISRYTVFDHVSSVLRKLGIRSRSELVGVDPRRSSPADR